MDPFSMRLQKTGNMIVKRQGLRVKRFHKRAQEEIKQEPNFITAQTVTDIVPNRFVRKLQQQLRRNNSVEDVTSTTQRDFARQTVFGVKSEKDSTSQLSEERLPVVQFVQAGAGVRASGFSGRLQSDNSDVSEERLQTKA